MGQLECLLGDSRSGGLAVAGELDGRVGEFDPVGIKSFFDPG
jgi:hypothetical protein